MNVTAPPGLTETSRPGTSASMTWKLLSPGRSAATNLSVNMTRSSFQMVSFGKFIAEADDLQLTAAGIERAAHAVLLDRPLHLASSSPVILQHRRGRQAASEQPAVEVQVVRGASQCGLPQSSSFSRTFAISAGRRRSARTLRRWPPSRWAGGTSRSCDGRAHRAAGFRSAIVPIARSRTSTARCP